jgi:hypothetical protein
MRLRPDQRVATQEVAFVPNTRQDEVLLEVKPDDPHPCWYRLEPGEFKVTS